MDECAVDDKFSRRITCILTYGGQDKDIWINYATLALICVISIFRGRNILLTIPEKHHRVQWILASTASLLGVCFFQVGLCCILGCAGISIIWCAVAGWLVNERKCHQLPGDAGQPTVGRTSLDLGEDVVLTAVLSVVIYYAVTTEFITTVAHFCALILGTLLSRMNRHAILVYSDSQVYETLVDPAESTRSTVD